MLRHCRKAKGNETGGVLAGRYSDDLACAIVTAASGAPPDSSAGRSWFRRGLEGLQGWIGRLWKDKSYYLGEWHYHPFAAPDPSGTDVSEMNDIAATESYKCPEPLLVIVGGNPRRAWRIRAFVFPRDLELVELHETEQ